MNIHLNVGENALMFGFPATGLAISLFCLQNSSKRSWKNYCYSHYAQFTSIEMRLEDLPKVQEETHIQICESKFGLFPLCLPSSQNHTGPLLFSLLKDLLHKRAQCLPCSTGPQDRISIQIPSYLPCLGSFETLFPQFVSDHIHSTTVVHDFTLKSFRLPWGPSFQTEVLPSKLH